ncbi:MAG: Uma2 family endonuclease [Sciscionella sp.]
MTSTAQWDHLLTLDEWDALPEEDAYRKAELVEGVLQLAPRPISPHQRASRRLANELEAQLRAAGLEAVQDVDVVLVAGEPPTVRCPDLVVTTIALLDSGPKRFAASDVELVIEILSPGTRRVDRIMKLADYADAGIQNYWIVDIDRPVSLDAFALIGARYEQSVTSATGTVTLNSPAPVTIDLAALVP